MADFARLVLDADTRGLKKAERDLDGVKRQSTQTAREVEASASKIGSAFKKVGVALVAAGITNVIYGFGKASVQAAIDAQEMESAFNVVFGNMADDVRAWAEETGNALGRSTQEIQRGALAFQELFGKALDPMQAAELSKQFAVLTQDLASFKNLSNEVAQQKLFSGLVGEAEPLRAVGVFLNEAAVQAKAAELGLSGVNGVLTDQEKIVARAAIIQEQLAAASGDVERTGDSAANQIKTYQAAVEELQVAIGQKLLPTFTPLVTGAANATTAFANLVQGFNSAGISLETLGRTLVTVGSGWAAYRLVLVATTAAAAISTSGFVAQAGAIAAASARMGILTSATTAATVATRTLFGVLAANPLGAIALAVGTLTAAMVNLGNAQRQARAETDNLIRSLRGLAQARSAEYATARSEVMAKLSAEQTELMRAEAELARSLGTTRLTDAQLRAAFEGRGGRLSTVPGSQSNVRGQAQEIYRLRQSVLGMESELRAAENAFEQAADAVSAIEVPAATAGTAMTSLASDVTEVSDAVKIAEQRMESAGAAARKLRSDVSSLFNSLFPDSAAQGAAQRDIMTLDAALRAGIISQSERDRAGQQIVSDSIPESVRRLNVIAADEIQKIGDEAEALAKRTGLSTEKITKSFEDMARGITGALQNLGNSIQNGGFLGILGGVLNLFTELGSAGLFGSGIQKNLAKPIAGARANGGPVMGGKTYIVGERGPELFTAPGTGRIISNDNMPGGETRISVEASPYFDVRVNGRIVESAPAIANAGAMQAQAMGARSARRTVRR